MAYENLGAYGAFLQAQDRNKAADFQGLQQGMMLTQMGQALEQARKRSMLEQMAQAAGGDPTKLMQGFLTLGDAQGASQVAAAGETMRKMEEARAVRDVLSNLPGPRGAAPAAPAARPMAFRAPDELAAEGITDPAAVQARTPQQVTTGRASAIQARVEQLTQAADMLRQRGLAGPAMEFDKQAAEVAKMLPKFAATTKEVRGPDGRPKIVQFNDAGEMLDTGLTPAEKLHFANQGAKIVPLDAYTGMQAGPSLVMEQSPDSRASNAVAWANNAISRERLALERQRQQAEIANGGKAPQGFRWKADGTLEAIPGGPAALGKALPGPAVDKLAAAGTAVEDTQRLAGSFQPRYGGKTFLGDMSNTLGRVLGDRSGQAQWWQDMDAHQNQTRHALFGSALTATELAAWEKTSITPRMDPEQIKQNLQRRQEIEARAASKLARAYKSGGYNEEQIKELLGVGAQYLSTPAPPVPGVGGQTVVRTPDGQTFTFPNQQAADAFKKQAGIP